jgi:SPP1 gp7 family putative phage head morphogenesis protein
MPVHRVKGGYRWGSKGAVYKDRAGAERQARAAYANGYRGDSLDRVKAKRLLRASVAAENAYVRDLRAIMHQVSLGVFRALRPFVRDDRPAIRADAVRNHDEGLRLLGITIRTHVLTQTGLAFDRMAVQVNKKNAMGNRALIGIHPGASVLDDIAKARVENLALMTKGAETYLTRAKAVIEAPENFGLRVEGLEKLLQEAGAASAWDAERVARGQTLKLNSQLSQTRQRNAGITQYKWSTSLDERVRPYHRALEGTIQTYGEPPVTDKYGHRNDPGQDILCRCVSIPIINFDEM